MRTCVGSCPKYVSKSRKACVQPDRGRVCAYYVALLVSAYGSPQTCKAGIEYASKLLLGFLYTYTGAAVPSKVRSKFALAAVRQCGDMQNLRRAIETLSPSNVLVQLMQCDVELSNHLSQRPASLLFEPWPHMAELESIESGILIEAFLALLGPGCPFIAAGGTAMHGEALADVRVTLMLRGSGLASSAFGSLIEQSVVKRLVTRWRQGPWLQRLLPLRDYCCPVALAGPESESLVPTETLSRKGLLAVAQALNELADAAAGAHASSARAAVLLGVVIPVGAWSTTTMLRAKLEGFRTQMPAPALGYTQREPDHLLQARLASQLMRQNMTEQEISAIFRSCQGEAVKLSLPCRAS